MVGADRTGKAATGGGGRLSLGRFVARRETDAAVAPDSFAIWITPQKQAHVG